MQAFSLILAVVLIMIDCARIRQNRENVFWVIPLLIWAFLVFMFYAVIFIDRLDGAQDYVNYGEISAILRMIGMIAIITVEGGRWVFHRRNVKARQSDGQ